MSFSTPNTDYIKNQYIHNQFDSRNFVVYSNDDFFEKDLFEQALYEKEDKLSISQSKSTSCSTEGIICNNSIKTLKTHTQSALSIKDNEVKTASDGYLISIDNIFDMNEEELFKFAPNKDKNNNNCVSPLIISKTDLKDINNENDTVKGSESNNLIPQNDCESTYVSSIKQLFQLDSVIPNKQLIKQADITNDTQYSRKENNFYSNSDINHLSLYGKDKDINNIKPLQSSNSNLIYFNSSSTNMNDKAAKQTKINDFYEFPSVGVGIVIIHKGKILLGRRIDSGMYGLPGGWLEFGESWAECASRELIEETGIEIKASKFKHIYTLNSINKEKNYHSVSCVMMSFADENEVKSLINKEPNKCYGWFWISLQELRNMYSLLFYPLRKFLINNSGIKNSADFRNLQKERIDIDSLFSNEEFLL